MLAALDWYLALDVDHDLGLAEDLRRRFVEGLERIGHDPYQFPRYLFGTRRFLLRRFPYAIVYDVEPIVVLAVAHQRARPGYWQVRKAP